MINKTKIDKMSQFFLIAQQKCLSTHDYDTNKKFEIIIIKYFPIQKY